MALRDIFLRSKAASSDNRPSCYTLFSSGQPFKPTVKGGKVKGLRQE